MTQPPISVALMGHSVGNLHPTGVDRYTRELVVALAARADMRVVVTGPPEPRSGGGDTHWVPDTVPVRTIRGSRRAVMVGWWTVSRPRIDVRCGPVDLVHVTLPLFPRVTRRPVVYTVHDLFPRQHPEWYSRQARFGFQRALRALEGAAAIIAVSSWTADALRSVPWVDPSAITIVPEGVSSRFSSPPDGADIDRVCSYFAVAPGGFDLFVGQVSSRKELEVLVEAMALARSPRPLVIAGPPGDSSATTKVVAERLGVSHLLRWGGFVPDRDLHVLLHSARALLHPSRNEGFGLTPLEAMVAGTPTVVADASALPETTGEAALRCAPGEPQAWAAALDALEDPALGDRMSQLGTEWVRRYRWDVVAEQTMVVYRGALERAERA